jgi:hypothetical protein
MQIQQKTSVCGGRPTDGPIARAAKIVRKSNKIMA